MPSLSLITSVPECPPYAFRPDGWTGAFQKGLSKAGLAGAEVLEVGVGAGPNAAFALKELGVKRYHGTDLDPRLPELANRNVRQLLPNGTADSFNAIGGPTDLLRHAEVAELVRNRVHTVVACIPQAIKLPGVPDHPDDTAHYYPQESFKENPFNQYALGLKEALLRQFRELVQESGDYSKSIILNLGGRVGLRRLLDLFVTNGFTPQLLHEEIVPQCPSTNLGFFVGLDKIFELLPNQEGAPCEFFSDPQGEHFINAQEAEDRRQAGASLYHKIYVMRGIPQRSRNR